MLIFFLPGVLLDGDPVWVLTDNNLSTCITLSDSYIEARAVVTLMLKKPYVKTIDIMVHGGGMQCDLSPDRCKDGFTTAVLQQGRTNHTCVEQPSPCPGAERCTPLGLTSQVNGMVTCRYRCSCPLPDVGEEIPCETILYSIGSGSRTNIAEGFKLCSVNIEWYR